jgi:hypothetical protein
MQEENQNERQSRARGHLIPCMHTREGTVQGIWQSFLLFKYFPQNLPHHLLTTLATLHTPSSGIKSIPAVGQL